MKRVLHLLLLLGALTGLLGVQFAYASVPQMTATSASAPGMDADCMKVMHKQQPQPMQGPCKGMTLECIAAMGCVAPPVPMVADMSLTVPLPFTKQAFWPSTSVLAGSDPPPEQHPPTFLG